MEILFISQSDGTFTKTGGSAVTMRNYNLLCNYGQVATFNAFSKGRGLLSRIFESIFNPAVAVMTYKKSRELKKILQQKKYDLVVFDNSKFGYFAKFYKKRWMKNIAIFFHNIEKVYNKRVHQNFGIKKIISNRNINNNERLSVKYADKIVLLNERDRQDLEKYYGPVDQSKVSILPVTFKNNMTSQDIQNQMSAERAEPMTGLFLGSNFPPNYEGIKWFVENVAEHINCNIEICGIGFGKCSEEFARKNVKVAADAISDTKPYYMNADFVIAPIFTGSGMKVKTCEALMYGKTIFGSTETFEGYDVDYDKVGGLCNTKEEYINAINKFAADANSKKFNEYSHQVFLEKYSEDAAKKIMEKILEF